VDRDRAENELVINIKKATSPEETAPKQKHVRSLSDLVHTIQNANDPFRMYRLYLGLSFFNFFLEWFTGTTYPS
jgi:hypothetical protein